jgi:2-oxoisovalerate dehydrogenase E2 component (dihydrolipoyl transacylase)
VAADPSAAPAPATVATSATSSAGPSQGRGPLGGDERSEFRGDLTPKPLASPSVRRHARELQIDLSRVRGSGPGGRIVHEDLVRHAEGAGARAERVPRHAERNDQHDVAVIGLRRQIALRMRESLRIPHFTYVEEIDVTELEALRVQLNDEHGKERGRLTVLPFLMRAIVLAVPSFPQMNARFDDEKGIVTRYGAVHIGVAAQTEAGLMVPVVRHAEARDLWSSAAEVTRLAEAARSGKATRDELSGSTITITSLGPLGGIVTTPVINVPEVAIVGVNRIVERPVIRSGAIVPRKLMNLSSSFDHRVVDGQHAAEFVQALRRYLECPALLFVE